MSVPPPGGWQDPGVPPNSGQRYGQQFNPTGYGAQQPPPPGWQQGAWSQQPIPPPDKGNSLKWLLVAVAVLLVIGISVGATLIFTRGDGGGGSTPTSGAGSDFASAGDTGPVGVIADEPTCPAYIDINNGIAEVEGSGWSDQRAAFGPSSSLTADQRAQLSKVSVVIRNAADQLVPLAMKTPHRVVRELYQQFTAFGRAYAESIRDYMPADNYLADAHVSIGNTLKGICNAITYGSASRSLSLQPGSPPTNVARLESLDGPQRFVTASTSSCRSWVSTEQSFLAAATDWQNIDTTVSGSGWSSEQKSIQLSTLPLIDTFASEMGSTGRQSGNPVFEDFAELGALYFNAYTSAGDKYIGSDSWLSYTGLRISNAISGACQAAAV